MFQRGAMKVKIGIYVNILKITLLLSYFFISSQITAMKPLNKPFLPDLTEQESIQAAQEESRSQILKSQRKQQCYDLMMILDPKYEARASQNDAYKLSSALKEYNFPILVSSSVVENFCLWQKKYYLNPEFLFVKPSDNDWYCYGHRTSPLMIFVPKKYLARFEQEPAPIVTQMKNCGFNIAGLDQITNLSYETLLSYIRKQESKIPEQQSGKPNMILADDLISFFIQPETPNLPTWNIYLIGHGGSRENTVGIVGYAKEPSMITGLPQAQFFKLMEYLQKINTSFLHYCTCYAGGQNLIKVRDTLSQLRVNFIVSAQGINESVTYSGFGVARFANFFAKLNTFFGNQASIGASKRESWENDPIASIVSEVIRKDSLNDAQPFVYIPAAGVFNALTVDKTVKIITKTVVKTHELEGKVIDLTDPNIRTVIIYPEYIAAPLKIHDHVAIVSPIGLKTKDDIINIHIFEKVMYEDKLSSIIPNFVSFQSSYSPITFVIKKLECFDYKNSSLGTVYSKPIFIENMIITISCTPTPNWYGVDAHVTVFFNYNNSTYSFSQEITDLSENSKKLFDQFNNLRALELKPSDLNELLKKSNLFKHCGLGDTNSDYVSLEHIIELIESQINKDFIVQKPGALKKSLLLKQKNFLEKSAGSFAMGSEEKDIDKQKKRMAYTKNLPKRIEQAKKLEAEIKELSWGQITIPTPKESSPLQQNKVSAQQIYLQDVANLQQKLAQEHEALQRQGLIKKPSWVSSIANGISNFFDGLSKKTWELIDSIRRYMITFPYSKRR